MKRLTLIVIGIVLFGSAFRLADNVITKLGMQHGQAQQYILDNLVGSFGTSDEDRGGATGSSNTWQQLSAFQIPRFNKIVAAGADQTTITKELCVYAKAYVNSREFLNAYQAKREKAKPTGEPLQMSGAEKAEIKKNIARMEADIAKAKKTTGMPKEVIAQYEAALAQVKKQMGNLSDDPTPNKTRWEAMYPEDPAVMVRKRLKEYIDLAKTVDFNAQLTRKGSKMVFVNPAYEQRSLKWKAIFRAGKEVNRVSTAFAEEWLRGDIISKTKTSMADL